MPALPADTCPYRRPFEDDFDECPAYRQVRFLAVDTRYRHLGTLNTCAHLEARSTPGRASFYPCCEIGTARDREAWARQIEAARLERIRGLARAVAEGARDASREMWEAKADQLRALREGKRATTQTRRVEKAARDYQAAAIRVLDRHGRDLKELRIDPTAVADLLEQAVKEWASQTTGIEIFRPSPQLLERFPPEVQAFLSPNVPSGNPGHEGSR